MSLQYDIQGYLAAVTMRTARTLLVEGKTDGIFMTQVVDVLNTLKMCSQKLYVDSAEMITEKTTVMGNREKAEVVHCHARASSMRMAVLVDREFRHFQINGCIADLIAAHYVENETLFWTRGHSIENYLLKPEHVQRMLSLAVGACLSPDSRSAFDASFDDVLTHAAALSLAALSCRVINRLEGLFSPDDWCLEGQKLMIKDSTLRRLLLQRGIPTQVAESFIEKFRFYKTELGNSQQDTALWISHGHLGLELSVAAFFFYWKRSSLQSHESVKASSTSFKDLKVRIGARSWIEELCRSTCSVHEVPFLGWICT